jgi:DEAD/DEAH box helicase domain-containing protein
MTLYASLLTDLGLRIRALLPDLIKFAYIPRHELYVNGDAPRGSREKSPDFSAIGPAGSFDDHEEHVLVLEFVENSKGKRSKHQALVFITP